MLLYLQGSSKILAHKAKLIWKHKAQKSWFYANVNTVLKSPWTSFKVQLHLTNWLTDIWMDAKINHLENLKLCCSWGPAYKCGCPIPLFTLCMTMQPRFHLSCQERNYPKEQSIQNSFTFGFGLTFPVIIGFGLYKNYFVFPNHMVTDIMKR